MLSFSAVTFEGIYSPDSASGAPKELSTNILKIYTCLLRAVKGQIDPLEISRKKHQTFVISLFHIKFSC